MEFLTVMVVLVVVIIRMALFAWFAVNVMITVSGAKESFGGDGPEKLIFGLAISWGAWLSLFFTFPVLFITAYGG